MEAIDLLKGSYDLHVHTGPDVMKRKLNDFEMAERLSKVGMKGFGIKSHYFCTAERASLINSHQEDVKVFGALSLNNSVGGMNPVAVEMAALDGAKIIWMPTVDSLNEDTHFKSGFYKSLPGWAKFKEKLIENKIESAPISVLDNEGNITVATKEVLRVIAKYDLILATGHLSKKEIFPLIDEANAQGVKKFVVTHPDFPSIALTKEEQKQLVEKGAIMEHCYTTPSTNKMEWNDLFEKVRYVGVGNCILSTDLGQHHSVYPDEGMLDFITQFLNHGFTGEEIQIMIQSNPEKLIN